MTERHATGQRSAGILLHVTSLPGPYGIGDLGPTAHAWVDQLGRARQTWWQTLPLGPPGAGNSPYQCFSAFAGNPALISPDALCEDGLLARSDLAAVDFPADRVDYEAVGDFKAKLLARAWRAFSARRPFLLREEFAEFREYKKSWLADFALFMALKEAHPEVPWAEWPTELVQREPAALARAREELADSIGRHEFAQFLFFRQLGALRDHAETLGIGLIGDLPIFISPESADVWANPELFLLDDERRPRFVAGVPPDFFSKTGQRWGNPLYDWQALRKQGYRWWIDRLRATLAQVDIVRLDHFRGFEAYWEIPADLPTAEKGRWAKAPGKDFFRAAQKALGKLPLIAEDLGVITPEVEALRAEFDLPGMRVLQFAFGGAVEDRFLPHNYERNTIVYTGTHDNDTTLGWYRTLDEKELHLLKRYVPHVEEDVAWSMIRLAWSSVADCTIAPLQDVLRLGSDARMNFPGTGEGNWGWRFRAEMLDDDTLDRLADVTEVYARAPHGGADAASSEPQPRDVGI